MPFHGYMRFPHIAQERIVFVSEDDLWLVSSTGGQAERLTAVVGEVSHPRFSPDGNLLAFVGQEEGPNEVYVMPASGGTAQRLTYQSSFCQVIGWSLDGSEILYTSNAEQANARLQVIFAIKPTGGLPHQVPVGMANAIAYGPEGGVVIGRNTGEYSFWKRYRGGRTGHLWCDPTNSGNFARLLNLNGNITNPCWVGSRIYFLSDHDTIGNLYSCTPNGDDLRQHTTHQDFYARHLSSDGQRLVYHAGTDLYLFDPTSATTQHIDVTLPSSRTQRNRKFVPASSHLDTYALHPKGHSIAITTRGKAFSMGNWEGPVLQHGEMDGVRYRFLEWLNDETRMIAIHDAPGRETLTIFNPEDGSEPKVFPEIEFGRATSLTVSPTDDIIAITNHRNELIVVDLKQETARVLDRSSAGRVHGISWSPDGRWLAYGFLLSLEQAAIKLCEVESGETHQVTDPILHDFAPAFDPEGKFLYFLGERVFNPVRDTLQFDFNFPRGAKPYLLLLQKDQRSPFLPVPNAPDTKDKAEKAKATDTEAKPEPTRIDLEGISERIVPFPVSEGRFWSIHGIKDKALFLSFPIEGILYDPYASHSANGKIEVYDFEKHKSELLIDKVHNFTLSRDNSTLLYRANSRLRVLKAGDKASKLEDEDNASRETGWLSLQRIKVSVQPVAEWRQMFAEAWRLQREQFWNEAPSNIDWDAIAARYMPLIERVGSRSELSDLFWEIQGELATSHAYEHGGDYRDSPHYRQGFLGVDWQYDEEHQRYRIARLIKGDPSDLRTTSPLAGPGLNVSVGDAILAINGQQVTATLSPQALLVNQANNEVQLIIEDVATQKTRVLSVKVLSEERSLRYREWVDQTRKLVHELSDGKIGYIHIPDMGGHGFAEFHRGYLVEFNHPALLIDVRWNGGGNVSSLLLEKLTRKRIGYQLSRWGLPRPYPFASPYGPMVALTNEFAGSDGDKFSHSFKLLGLGPLIGTRTWGGTIGIFPRHHLVDGTTTTQPEFANWFQDVELGLENNGTDPDIEVDITPQDYLNNSDPQLQRGIAEALRLIEIYPAFTPPT